MEVISKSVFTVTLTQEEWNWIASMLNVADRKEAMASAIEKGLALPCREGRSIVEDEFFSLRG